ncbi:MAG: dienelactone hydrolase family protein [Roseicyclus sp.]|nr:dienelactone hydrolase family protein [Roseicyclus sp.]
MADARLTPARLRALLGQPGGHAGTAALRAARTETMGPNTLTRLMLRIGAAEVPGLYLRPEGDGPFPAVLYCHAHGNRYDRGAEELILGRPALVSPYGPALAERGIASLCIDLAPFGGRQAEGPEAALAKALHWQGHTLMGQMLAELSAAFGWLAARPEIDARRIATLGLSMGGTHAYWLAALEPRVAACAHLCVLADLAPLIATGAHDLHGPYMTVPGLLAEGDMGDVAALVAPRPQLVCLGAADPLTPETARDPALARLRAAYADAPDRLALHVDPDTGHRETPAMRAAVLAFLARHLSP